VRGSVRSLSSNPAKLAHLRAMQTEFEDRLELVEAELLAAASWEAAVRDCTFVLHVASPFPSSRPSNEDELIIPAREGTLNVLRAAAAAGVRRTVVTSSVAAIMSGHDHSRFVAGAAPFTEEDWSVVDSPSIAPYEKSKTLAERAAWEFAQSEEARGMELATVNPGFVLGPPLSSVPGTSVEVMCKLLNRELPRVPRLSFPCVDVRDVARAHLLAMTTGAAAGQRFLCANETLWFKDLGSILAREFNPQGYRVPDKELPHWMLRVASICDKSVRMILPDVGLVRNCDNSKIQSVLGLHFRDSQSTLVDMGHALVELGVVPRSKQYRGQSGREHGHGQSAVGVDVAVGK